MRAPAAGNVADLMHELQHECGLVPSARPVEHVLTPEAIPVHVPARNELIWRASVGRNTCRWRPACRSIQEAVARQRPTATMNYSGQKNSLSPPASLFMRRSQALVRF